MPFRLPKKCRGYFKDLIGKEDNKLSLWFDAYYLCLMVGLACTKINNDTDLEASELVDEYPTKYKMSRDYIAALLIEAETERISVDIKNPNALERLMTSLIDPNSKTRLSKLGEDRLNQYADRGMDIISDVMPHHMKLELFYEDYFDCFNRGLFFDESTQENQI